MKAITIIRKIILFPLQRKKLTATLLVGVFLWWVFTNGAPNYTLIKTVELRPGRLVSQIVSSGVVTSEHADSLHFATSGRVNWVGVSKGDVVKKGTVLATLDRERIEASLRQATQDFMAAQAQVEKNYDTTGRKTVESFDEKITRTALEAAQNKAYDAMRIAQRSLEDTTLIAPYDGTITDATVFVGQEVLSTTPIVSMADLTALRFDADIDEIDIAKVNSSQKASVALDAFPETPFEASVSGIGQKAVTTSTGATAFTVNLSLPKHLQVRMGMNGEARLITDEKLNVLSVPLEAVQDDSMVWIEQDRHFKKVPVKQGISSDIDVEITSGLKSGDKVVISGFDQLEKKSILMKLLGW